MKAIIIEKTGGVEQFTHTELEKPQIGNEEVLIEVKAISINPVDYKVRAVEEVLHMISGEGYPAILGWDISGVVVETGSDSKLFSVGDKVFGMVNFPGKGNAYAQFVAAPETHLAKIPDDVSFTDAAATTLAALTALQALKNNVKEGDRVLIHAGSGGVGHFAIQMAKHIGAYVISTSSAKNRDFILSLGADQHIDYRTQAFEEVLTDIDFVLDGLGGENLVKSIKVVKEGGNIISLPTPLSEEHQKLAESNKVNAAFMLVASNGNDMNILSEYLAKGIIKPHVSATFSFSDMSAAHLQVESGRTVGKVVVEL